MYLLKIFHSQYLVDMQPITCLSIYKSRDLNIRIIAFSADRIYRTWDENH